jgi:hypothetical protein
MCSPAAAMTMQGAGAASSAVGAYYKSASDKAQLELSAGMADVDARMAEAAARTALNAGAREVQKSQLQTAGLKGTQRASMAANGVDLGEGSPLNVLNTTDTLGEIDANTLQANAIRQAMGYRTQAVNFTNQATTSRAGAGAISPSGAAFTSLLGSAGSVAAGWYQYSKVGGGAPSMNDNSYERKYAAGQGR